MDEKKMNDEETQEKAEKLAGMTQRVAETASASFEEWLNAHKDASREEAHKELVKTINGAIMMSQISLFMLA